MKYSEALIATAFSIGLYASPAIAQTTPSLLPPQPKPEMPTKAERVKDVRYLLIETIEAKPGARLYEILSKHIEPAYVAAGAKPALIYHTEVGTPRTIMITELPGGPGDLAWSDSPDDVKAIAALAKQLGSPEKAMAMMKEYTDGILTRSRELVHEHTK